MKKKKSLMFILALGLLLAACSDPQLPPDASSPSIYPPGAAEPAETEPAAPVGKPEQSGLRELPPVQGALADLSARLSIPAGEMDVLAVEEVIWPDTGLGCGQPGMAYLQVLTPGYRVQLRAARGHYVYHTDNKQTVVLCKEGDVNQKPGSPGAIEPGLEIFVNKAVMDLVGRLGVQIEDVEVREVKSVVWPDAGLGCPQPGMGYKQVPVDGILIRLSFGGRMYFYHGGGTVDPFLCESTSQMVPEIDPKSDELLPPPGSETD